MNTADLTASPPVFAPASGLLASLDLLHIRLGGPLVHIELARPAKRNALNDALVAQLHTAFVNLPTSVRAAVVSGQGEHFCAGLDLSELAERNTFEGILHSRGWHAALPQSHLAGHVIGIQTRPNLIMLGGGTLATARISRRCGASHFVLSSCCFGV